MSTKKQYSLELTAKGKQYSDAALNDGHYDDPKADALWYVESNGVEVRTSGNLPLAINGFKRLYHDYADYCGVEMPATFADYKALFTDGLVLWDDVTPPLGDKLHLTLTDVHEWMTYTLAQFDNDAGEPYNDDDVDVVVGETEFTEHTTQEDIDAGMRWVNEAIRTLRTQIADFDSTFHDHFGCA